MKKISVLFSCFIVLLSCNNKKEDSTVTSPDNQVTVQTDSSALPVPDPSINPYAGVDLSPMDMSYYPVDYPKTKMVNTNAAPPLARVIYSRPHLQGRHIFHEVLKYGEPWRLGANEATELELFSDATIQGKEVKAGRYALYCIPQPKEWTIVLNSNIDSWGLKPDTSRDVARFTVPVTTTGLSLEYFTMVFQNGSTSSAELLMAWDNAEARLPVSFR